VKICALLSHYPAMQFAIFLFTWLQDSLLRFTKLLHVLGTASTCRASSGGVAPGPDFHFPDPLLDP